MADEITFQLEGVLVRYSVEGSGQKKDGSPWTRYKYVILTKEGEKTLSGFKSPEELHEHYVIATYSETPNKYPDSPPYKNVVNMVEGVSPGETKQSDQQYNVNKVQTNNIDIQVENEFKSPPTFFVILKKAVDMQLHSDKDISLNETFDKLWNFAIAKRKEKLK